MLAICLNCCFSLWQSGLWKISEARGAGLFVRACSLAAHDLELLFHPGRFVQRRDSHVPGRLLWLRLKFMHSSGHWPGGKRLWKQLRLPQNDASHQTVGHRLSRDFIQKTETHWLLVCFFIVALRRMMKVFIVSDTKRQVWTWFEGELHKFYLKNNLNTCHKEQHSVVALLLRRASKINTLSLLKEKHRFDPTSMYGSDKDYKMTKCVFIRQKNQLDDLSSVWV